MKEIWVKCDKCDWIERGVSLSELAAWHNKPCPKCNDSVIITDKEMELIHGLLLLEGAGLLRIVGDEESGPPEAVQIRFNSAPLRKPEAA